MTVTSDFVNLASCDVADLANWTATGQASAPTNDTTEKKEGDASINMGKSGVAAVDFGYYKTISSLDLEGKMCFVWIWTTTDALSKLNVAEVRLQDSVGRNLRLDILNGTSQNPRKPDVMLLGACWNIIWSGVEVSYHWYDSGVDLTDIVRIELYFETNNVGDTITHGDLKMDFWHYGTYVDITGGSEPSRLGLGAELMSAEATNAWGIIDRASGSGPQFIVRMPVHIGQGGTAWVKTDGNFLFQRHRYWDGKVPSIRVYADGDFISGILIDAGTKATKNGYKFEQYKCGHNISVIYVFSGGVAGFYSSQSLGANTIYGASGSTVKCYNSITQNIGGYVDVENCFICGAGDAFNYGFNGTADKITIFGCTNIHYAYAGSSHTFKNFYGRNNTNTARLGSTSGNQYFINFDLDQWNFIEWGTGIVYRQYEFNRKILCEDKTPWVGKSWTLKDKDGNTVASGVTQADGKLSAVDLVVTHGTFDQAHGDTEQLKGPFDLWVDGETNCIDLNIYGLAIDTKDVDATETMINMTSLINAIYDIKGTGFAKDTDSLTNLTHKAGNKGSDAIYDLSLLIRKIVTNGWKIENKQLIIYDDDGNTPYRIFALKGADGKPTEVNVKERVVV